MHRIQYIVRNIAMYIYKIFKSVATIEGDVNERSWYRRGPTGCSRDILHKAKGDPVGRVHSDQKVLKVIRRGRLIFLIEG